MSLTLLNLEYMSNHIKILETGDGWIGVEKPCGISIHNDPGNDVLSIVSSMIKKDRNDKTSVQPVHRLDKDTSGVLLLAYTPDTLKKLSDYFNKSLVKKKYLALVHGNFEKHKQDLQIWNFPLTKDAGGRDNPAGKGKRVNAETRFTILQQSEHYALLQITLITGRKHQIRRHAKLSGHPVTGDMRYGSKKSLNYLKNKCGYTRLGLHAQSIEIPEMIPPLGIRSETIPKEMDALLKKDL
jgi:RluA family pseudouridine synthase